MFAEPTSLDDFITAQSQCVGVSADGGETITLDGYEARLYASVACGPVETSYLYLVTPTQGYVLTIRAMTPYRFLSDFIWEMLDTFTVQEE
jgi:hypothetical protein